MADHVIAPLKPETFPAWLALARKHDGVRGGCSCTDFHGRAARASETVKRATVAPA
jgi:hypothetical protein